MDDVNVDDVLVDDVEVDDVDLEEQLFDEVEVLEGDVDMEDVGVEDVLVDEVELEEGEVNEVFGGDVEVEVLVALLLLVNDEVLEVEDVHLDEVKGDDVNVDVAAVLVMLHVMLEEQEVELVVEVAQVGVLQLDVEFAHVGDEVVMEDDVEVELHVTLLQIVVQKALEVEDVQFDVVEEDEVEGRRAGRASGGGACAWR